MVAWKAMMHSDDGDSHYTTLEKGQLIIYRGKPGHQEAIPYKTPSVSDQGHFVLGITASKRLVIYSGGEGKENNTVWKSEVLEPWRL